MAAFRRLQVIVPAALILAGCYPPLRGADGASPAAPSPARPWTPPSSAVDEAKESHLDPDSLPSDYATRRDALTTTDLVNLALEHSPETRATWLAARAASASYGAARSALFPDINASLGVTQTKTAAIGGRTSVQQITYGPSVSLSWLLLDFGGRSGAIDAAAQGMFAANWNHNAVLADVVRRTVQGYFNYVGARSLVDAQRTSLQESQVNLTATQERRTVGVATVADVYQAQTVVGQAQLALQQAESTYAANRSTLAILIGLRPSAHFDVDSTEANTPVADVAGSIDSLMRAGLAERPDLSAERATVDERYAQARQAAALSKPSLSATAQAGTVWLGSNAQAFPSYSIGVALGIPLFNGYGWQYTALAAKLNADAESARLHTQEQQVAGEVYDSWQTLRTATQSVATSEDLFRSASASVDAANARYRQGVGSILELLTAENALASARAQRIQSRVQWHDALVQLAHDAGILDAAGVPHLQLTSPTSPSGND